MEFVFAVFKLPKVIILVHIFPIDILNPHILSLKLLHKLEICIIESRPASNNSFKTLRFNYLTQEYVWARSQNSKFVTYSPPQIK